MRFVKKRKFLTLVCCLMVFLLTACGTKETAGDPSGSKENITLSYAFFAPDNTFPAVQMKKWAEELESRTDGQVKIEMFFGGTLLEASNMFDGVANGTADIGLTATTYEPKRFPLLEISDLPSGYPNSEVASQVVHDLIKEYPPEALKDFKIITAFATEPSYIQSKEAIASLKDLSGKQLRISGGLTPVMEKLGAAPVGMSQNEAPEALQTGVIEGNISSREVLKDLKLAESVKHVTDYPLTITSFVAVMNKDKWEALPEDVQKVMEELSSEMSEFTGKYLDEHVQEAMQWSEKEEGLSVVSLTAEEKKKWDELLESMQKEAVEKAEAKGLPAKEYQEKLYELIEKYTEK
ncbi:TRAP transporter substrate-binding protein [Bacillus norwichensis]|uniref:TRAP transporter substrate-binding protein n=1 Tax=Bacillus norwichensis TaxID=2762217 RepID=A0ABR8VK82_9BACI|nr:TRAP transporter substrate-binding protein [Bacillus norwichensis]MBD8005176.1 TRAP transporter substrate-binding protein [Bacillus norwichensis]